MCYDTKFIHNFLNRGYYVGVLSVENTGQPAAQYCTFRGNLVKLNVRSGAIIWKTDTLLDNGGRLGGYSGAAIWGSSPAIDIARGHVYVGTGNLYLALPEVLKCQEAQNNRTTPPAVPDQCFGKDIHFDSILALDLNSGKIAWATQLGGYDVFTFACLVPKNPNCPPGPNMDVDFGEAPMMLTIFQMEEFMMLWWLCGKVALLGRLIATLKVLFGLR